MSDKEAPKRPNFGPDETEFTHNGILYQVHLFEETELEDQREDYEPACLVCEKAVDDPDPHIVEVGKSPEDVAWFCECEDCRPKYTAEQLVPYLIKKKAFADLDARVRQPGPQEDDK